MLPLYEMQLAVFEALRRLGFTSDEIYAGYNNGQPVTVLKAQGKQFVLNYPKAVDVPQTAEEYVAGWQEACEAWNSKMDNTERTRIFEERFLVVGEAVQLLEALSRKGFTWTSTAGLN